MRRRPSGTSDLQVERCLGGRRAHDDFGASGSHGLDEEFSLLVRHSPHDLRILDGERVGRYVRGTFALANSNLIVDLLAGMQQEVFREYLQPGCRATRNL